MAGLILVLDPGGIVAFDLPKSLFSRGLEWLTGGVLLLSFLTYGAAILPLTRLHLAVLALVAANLLSAVFAENAYVAAFGELDRYLGLTFVGDMAVLYLACAVAFRSLDDWLALASTIGLATGAAIAYGAVQSAGLDPISWQESPAGRPFATFGNADQFGHFLSVAFGLGLGVSAAARGARARLRRAVGAALAASALVVAASIATRGSLLGIAAALAVLVPLLVRLDGITPRALRRTGVVAVVSLALLAAVLAVSPLGARSLATLGGVGIQDRLVIYESGARAFVDRPLLGYGPDNFGVAYPRYRQVRSLAVAGINTPQTSAHDWILDAAVATGSLGLLALLALIAVSTWTVWSTVLARLPAVGAPVLLAWTAYWAHGLVAVGSVAVGWLPWASLGAIAAIAGERTQPKPVRRVHPAIAALVLATAALGALSGGSSFLANRDAGEAETARASDDPAGAVAAAESAVRRDPGRADYWNVLGLARDGLAVWRASGDAYAEAARRAPYLETYWANLSRSRARQALAGDESSGGAAAALAAADAAARVDPNNPEGHAVLAEIALAFSRCDLALRSAATAISLYQGDPRYDRWAASASACSSDPAAARPLLERAIAAKDSPALHVAAAKVALRLGDRSAAREHAERALRLEPLNTDAQAVLRETGP